MAAIRDDAINGCATVADRDHAGTIIEKIADEYFLIDLVVLGNQQQIPVFTNGAGGVFKRPEAMLVCIMLAQQMMHLFRIPVELRLKFLLRPHYIVP